MRGYHVFADGTQFPVSVCGYGARKVLAWRLSNTLDVDFCVDALEETMACYGCPEIFNTDQGSQFTSEAFTDVLKHAQAQISIDGAVGGWTMSLSSVCGVA